MWYTVFSNSKGGSEKTTIHWWTDLRRTVPGEPDANLVAFFKHGFFRVPQRSKLNLINDLPKWDIKSGWLQLMVISAVHIYLFRRHFRQIFNRHFFYGLFCRRPFLPIHFSYPKWNASILQQCHLDQIIFRYYHCWKNHKTGLFCRTIFCLNI